MELLSVGTTITVCGGGGAGFTTRLRSPYWWDPTVLVSALVELSALLEPMVSAIAKEENPKNKIKNNMVISFENMNMALVYF